MIGSLVRIVDSDMRVINAALPFLFKLQSLCCKYTFYNMSKMVAVSEECIIPY